jgi:prepilin-type N-terminal cleavage/methylation domain-containing protein
MAPESCNQSLANRAPDNGRSPAGVASVREELGGVQSRVRVSLPAGPATGFSLLELMVVIAILGLLLMIAFPAWQRTRENSMSGRFLSDLRLAVAAFELYAAENNGYPEEALPGIVPKGMATYLPKRMNWTLPTAIGGQWDWDYLQFGVTAGVSVYAPNANIHQMRRMDRQIDDGNLATGMFRARASGYISVVEE